jgi:hypothetical protein
MDRSSHLIDSPSANVSDGYLELAMVGLSRMFDPNSAGFPQTARLTSPPVTNFAVELPELVFDGHSVRDTAIAALGIAQLEMSDQRTVLTGLEAADLVTPVMARALAGTDPGAVALTTWLAAETGAEVEAARGVRKIRELVLSRAAIPTTDQSWMLTALVEYGLSDDLRPICVTLVNRLLRHQHAGGIFPHVVPPGSQPRFRAHVGGFADQAAAIQALARYAADSGDHRALVAANLCAQRIRELQGAAGQWWWQYDARTSEVVQEYPVYSAHQHAMAPMALFDLLAAGGDDHRSAVGKGLAWVAAHPELPAPLVDSGHGVIWRKIGRREPAQAMRSVRALTTAIRPGLRLRALDPIFPPVRIDHECRPSELGWLLYAWTRPNGR